MFTPRTAILVFSRFAEEEAKEKKYGRYIGKRGGFQIAKQLIDHTLNEAVLTGVPVFKIFPDRQKGNSFGEKLCNAVEAVTSSGFSNVVIIGTDCPSISTQLLVNTIKKLSTQKMVLGPCNDGGVYLIGIQTAAYSREHFLSVPWLTPKVFDTLENYATQAGLLLSLEPLLTDTDDYSSLVHWAYKHCNHFISVFVHFLISSAVSFKQEEWVSKTLLPVYFLKDRLRGPPALFPPQ